MAVRPDLPLPRRRLRLQALGRRPARRSSPACRGRRDPRVLVGRRHRRRRRRRPAHRRPRARADRRLLHADRRRPLRLRAHRRDQRAVATSTRWAASRCRALNLVAFPLETLGAGACWRRSCAAAPTRSRRRARAIVGGHSIDDPEPKYGLAVTGIVHPDAVLDQRRRPRRRRARPDQAARRRRDRDRDQARAGGRRRSSRGRSR